MTTADTPPGGDPHRVPDLDPRVARSAGLGAIGPAAARERAAAANTAVTAGGASQRGTGRSPASRLVSRRRLVGTAACAIAAIAVVAGGLSVTSGGTRTTGVRSATSPGTARLTEATLAAARARYASAVANYEQDLRTITTSSVRALTGGGSMSDAVGAWNQFATDTQGLSAAALSIPASSATAPDVEALVSSDNSLLSAVSQFEQDPTSQDGFVSVKSSLVSSAAAAAQVGRDLGVWGGELQATSGT